MAQHVRLDQKSVDGSEPDKRWEGSSGSTEPYHRWWRSKWWMGGGLAAYEIGI